MDADGSISAAEAEKFVQENHKDEDLDVQGACVRLPVSNLKPKEGRKRKLSVGFSAEKPLVQIFENRGWEQLQENSNTDETQMYGWPMV